MKQNKDSEESGKELRISKKTVRSPPSYSRVAESLSSAVNRADNGDNPVENNNWDAASRISGSPVIRPNSSSRPIIPTISYNRRSSYDNRTETGSEDLAARKYSMETMTIEDMWMHFDTTTVEKNWASDLMGFLEDIAYTGFNYLAIMTQIQTVPGWKEDIKFLIALSCERGSNLEKILESCSPVGKLKIADLIKKYNIKRSIIGAADRRRTVTLPRIQCVFSWLACLYSKNQRSRVVSLSYMRSVFATYPIVMMCPVFANLIPRSVGGLTQVIVNAYCIHQYLFSYQITNRATRENKGEMIESVEKFVKLGLESDHIPESLRFQFCCQNDVLTASEDGTYSVNGSVSDASKTWLIYKNEYKTSDLTDHLISEPIASD